MPDLIRLEVVTPERQLVKEDVESVELPGQNGYLGILPGHAPLVGQLGTGHVVYAAAGWRRFLFVSGGFVEVAEGSVRVIADVAEPAGDIDVNRAKAAQERAQRALSTSPSEEETAADAAALARAEGRIAAAERKP